MQMCPSWELLLTYCRRQRMRMWSKLMCYRTPPAPELEPRDVHSASIALTLRLYETFWGVARVNLIIVVWIPLLRCRQLMQNQICLLHTVLTLLLRWGKMTRKHSVVEIWNTIVFFTSSCCNGRLSPLSPRDNGNYSAWGPHYSAWFGEFCYCCCLPLLPELACSIHATWLKPFSRPLYRGRKNGSYVVWWNLLLL